MLSCMNNAERLSHAAVRMLYHHDSDTRTIVAYVRGLQGSRERWTVPTIMDGCGAARRGTERVNPPFPRHAGDFVARPVHAVYPPSVHCESPPRPPGSSPGALGPHGRALRCICLDQTSAATGFRTFAGLQVGRLKAQFFHTKTLNIDLSLSDRPQKRSAQSVRIPAGTGQARACLDKVLSMALKPAAKRLRIIEAPM